MKDNKIELSYDAESEEQQTEIYIDSTENALIMLKKLSIIVIQLLIDEDKLSKYDAIDLVNEAIDCAVEEFKDEFEKEEDSIDFSIINYYSTFE